jgi:RND family efflux transporter MFP subunit
MNIGRRTNRATRCAPVVLAFFAAHSFAVDIPQLDCVVEPHMVIDLSTQIDGIVDTMRVERGDFVEADQILVTLDSGVEQAAVDFARERAGATSEVRAGEVSVAFAQRREERVHTLFEENAISTDQFDEVETEARLAQLQLAQAEESTRLAELELRRAEETLDRHTIRSPINGVVVQRYLSPGESVKFQPMLRLAQIDPLRVEVIVPVSAFGMIEVGQMAIVQPEAPVVGNYQAEIVIVDRVADAASGTFRVALDLPNPDYSLPSGLKCMVQFLGDDPLPLNAETPDSESIQAAADSETSQL